VARIPKQATNGKPKEAGHGAERLVTLSSQGIYHQSLLGQVSSRVGRWTPRMGSRLGSRGVLMRERCSNSMRKRQSILLSPAFSGQDIGFSSRPQRPTSYVGRSKRSNVTFSQTQSSRTSKSSRGIAGPRRRTRRKSISAVTVATSSRAFTHLSGTAPESTTHRVPAPQGRPREGRGETQGDGGGAQGLHPAVGALFDDGRGYQEAILSNHQGEISRVFQEAQWRQQVAESV
jgi:hypothetical protein